MLPPPSVPSPTASSSSRCPTDSHPCCHPGEQLDDTESPPQLDSLRKPAPPHERRVAPQSPSPPGCMSVWLRMESIADTPTLAAETPLPGCRAATTSPSLCPACASATHSPTNAAHPHPPCAWQTGIPASALRSIPHLSVQIGWNRFPARSLRSASVPAASQHRYIESRRQWRPAAVLVGRHAQLRSSLLVKPTAGPVSRVIHRPRHRIARLQIPLQHPQPARVGILPRRDSQHRLKATLQMKRALAEFFGQPVQRQRLIEMLLDKPADRLHPVRLSIPAERLWPAPQARPIPGLLRPFGIAEESNVLPPRPPRRTRRPAIHSST